MQSGWQVELVQSVLPPPGHPGGAPGALAAPSPAAPEPQLASTRCMVAAESPAAPTRTSPLRSEMPPRGSAGEVLRSALAVRRHVRLRAAPRSEGVAKPLSTVIA